MRTIFYKFFRNIAGCFWGYNLLLHLLAILLTYIIVVTGFDWFYFLSTRNTVFSAVIFPAVIIGGLIPIMAPLVLYGAGKLNKNSDILNTAYAVSQSAIAGLLISSFYKAFTGRLQPETLISTATDISRDFRFGFLRGGVFWGWPSTHTTIAFAMAASLIILYPKNKKIIIGSLLYAFYVGLGVSMSIHWFSEFVAGAIIGSVIGSVVGNSFRQRYPH